MRVNAFPMHASRYEQGTKNEDMRKELDRLLGRAADC